MQIPILGTKQTINIGPVWATLSSTTKDTASDDKVADARIGAMAIRVCDGERVLSAGAIALGGALPLLDPKTDTVLQDELDKLKEELSAAQSQPSSNSDEVDQLKAEIADLRLQLGIDIAEPEAVHD